MGNNNYYNGGRSSRPRGGSYDYFGEPQRRKAQDHGSSYKRPKKRRTPLGLLLLIDLIAAALLLGIFYVTNYEMHGETGPIESLPVPSWLVSDAPLSTPPESTPTADTSAAPAGTPTASAPAETTADPNNWRAKYADKFTDGAVEQNENSYKSANINVSIKKIEKDGSVLYVADIYVAELKYFRTAFAKKPDVMGGREMTDTVAKQNNAILAINGDHCVDNEGTVVRNGQLYRKPKSSLDVLVMNYDGSMQTFSPDEYDVEKTLEQGVYQVWSFGPMLLQNGQPMTQFNSTMQIGGNNPRSAVGYYEPGHYCFVVVDGRQPGYSDGYTLEQLSQLFAELGCTAAYNMDGGRSAEMVFMGDLASHPMEGRRSTTDILYIGE